MKPSPVINSSPLIALCAALPELDLLENIIKRLVVPQEVMDELLAGGLKDDTVARVTAAAFCEVLPHRAVLQGSFTQNLGTGEAAVIQAALDEKLPLVIIDEVRGRRMARLAGLKVVGSLGMLVELCRAGFLPSVDEPIRRMRSKGIYLSEQVIQIATLRSKEQG